MAYEKIKPQEAPPFRRHTLTETGDFISVVETSRVGSGGAIKKLNAQEYLYVPDGEIREFRNKAVTRAESIVSLRRTFRRVRDLVNANVRQDNARNVKWVTFTYADRSVIGLEGTRRVARDFDNFYKRLRRYCAGRGFGSPEHITVLEPQRSGVWHLHTLLIWDHKAPFISNADMAALWRQGFTKTCKLPAANMGAYLSAYLSDAKLEDVSQKDIRAEQVKQCEINGEKKQFVKGGRIHFYPSGCNIIRHSTGIKYPDTYQITAAEVEHFERVGKVVFDNTFKYIDDQTGFEVVVRRRCFSMVAA